jgi:hypothetical protein
MVQAGSVDEAARIRQITLKLEAQRKSRVRACTPAGLFAGDKAEESDIPEIRIRRQRPNGKLRNNFKIHVPKKDFSLKQMHYCH